MVSRQHVVHLSSQRDNNHNLKILEISKVSGIFLSLKYRFGVYLVLIYLKMYKLFNLLKKKATCIEQIALCSFAKYL